MWLRGEIMKRPFIFINTAMTADGKISTIERKQIRISNEKDMERVDKLRSESDAVLVGMNTVIVDDPKLTIKSEKLRRERIKKGLAENPIKVTIGKLDNLSMDSDFMSYGNAEKIIFASSDSDPYKIEEIGNAAKIFLSDDKDINLRYVVETLYILGVKKLMIEGGSSTNYRFLKEGLVDEIYITIAPKIFGGKTAPTLVDGRGFKENEEINLKLISVDRLSDNILLRYKVIK